MSIESAVPLYLVRFGQATAAMEEGLRRTAGVIEDATDRYDAACAGPHHIATRAGGPGADAALRDWAANAAELGAWVRRVGEAFADADSNDVEDIDTDVLLEELDGDLLGLDPDDLEGQPPIDFSDPNWLADLLAAATEAEATGSMVTTPLEILVQAAMAAVALEPDAPDDGVLRFVGGLSRWLGRLGAAASIVGLFQELSDLQRTGLPLDQALLRMAERTVGSAILGYAVALLFAAFGAPGILVGVVAAVGVWLVSLLTDADATNEYDWEELADRIAAGGATVTDLTAAAYVLAVTTSTDPGELYAALGLEPVEVQVAYWVLRYANARGPSDTLDLDADVAALPVAIQRRIWAERSPGYPFPGDPIPIPESGSPEEPRPGPEPGPTTPPAPPGPAPPSPEPVPGPVG